MEDYQKVHIKSINKTPDLRVGGKTERKERHDNYALDSPEMSHLAHSRLRQTPFWGSEILYLENIHISFQY